MARSIIGLLVLFAAVCALAGEARAASQLEELLASDTAPNRVVFEILDDDETGLSRALPEVQRQAELLRARFPGLPIAVVTHGQEQFGLLTVEASGPRASIHTEAQALAVAEVDLHVCGAHASWYGHDAQDFPEYVDVAPSGPALLIDYRALGYDLIRLRVPES